MVETDRSARRQPRVPTADQIIRAQSLAFGMLDPKTGRQRDGETFAEPQKATIGTRPGASGDNHWMRRRRLGAMAADDDDVEDE